MMKTILTPILIALFAVSAKGNTDGSRRLVVSAGVYEANDERTDSWTQPNGNVLETPQPIAVPVLRVSYEMIDNLQIGCYLAYTNMGHGIPLVMNSQGQYELIDSEGVVRITSSDKYYFTYSNRLFYGLSAEYDVLPILTGKDNLRFNLYLTTNLGLVSSRWSNLKGVDWVSAWHGPLAEYGMGLGLSYYVTQRVGLNLGYSFGKYLNKDNDRYSAVLSFKF